MKNIIIKLLKVLKLYSILVSIKYYIIKSFPCIFLNRDEYKFYKLRRKETKQRNILRRKLIKFYSQFIGKGVLCFDIGANFGNRTEVFVKLGAKVITVEPQKACLKHLNKLFVNERNVFIIDKAVGENEGFAELSVCEVFPGISTMSENWKSEGRFSKEYKWEKTEKVAMTTLDILINEYGLPTFCKIDVEGFEKFVIKGLSKPIPYISFEFHKELINESKQCVNHLLSIGNPVFNCSLGESLKMLFSTWVTSEELFEKLALQKDELLWGDIYVKFV